MAPIPPRMSSVSDDGDTVCPLCAEEMDITDQQLKPCKCGYEICVWCWHHIMEMAEKEKTEGRCPACRTPYDKERIVGMSVNCERLVAEMNGGRRHRSQKGKSKVSAEARKHLSTVRVVQRNLVYIIGLPADLCDESLLERKEYFGQYGEILKVSISRSASTTNQQASNGNIYITYAREEDAVRCIQAVHNYVLDGKRLRACFGTTKYCHAWLRNMSCSNPDCLYLHDIGSQEDSFTKDEVISAYTRSVVSQVPSSNLQRRVGSLLPPAEDWCNLQTLSDKHSVNNASKASEVQATVSNAIAGRLPILPAASFWGSRASKGSMLSATTVCSENSMKQKVETKNHSSTYSSITMGAKEVSSAWHDDDVTASLTEEGNGNPLPSGSSKFHSGQSSLTTESDPLSLSLHFDAHGFGDSAWDDEPIIESKLVEESFPLQAPSAVDGECQTSGAGLSTNCASDKISYSFSHVSQDKDIIFASGKNIDSVNLMCEESLHKQRCSSTDVNQHTSNMDKSKQNMGRLRKKNAFADYTTLKNQLSRKEQYDSEDLGNLASVSTPSWNIELPKMDLESSGDGDQDSSLAVIDTRQIGSVDATQRSCSPQFTHSLSNHNHQPCDSLNNLDGTINSSSGESFMHTNAVSNYALSNEGDKVSLNNMYKPESSLGSAEISSIVGCRYVDSSNDLGGSDKDANVNTKESSIITNILSLDFDPWNDSLSLTNNLSMLLNENDGQNGSFMLSRPRILQNTNQSRFSFARQENQVKSVEPSIRDIENMKRGIILKDSLVNDFQNGSTAAASSGFCGTLSDRPAGVSKLKMLAPPGFSVPTRSPPPGFSNQDRFDQSAMAKVTENYLHGNSLSRNQYEVRPTGKNSVDVEFIDPAILAVGKGHMPIGTNINNFGSAFPERFRSEDDLIHQLLTKRSASHQNMRISNPVMENFFALNDSYPTSYLFPQNHATLSPSLQFSLQQPQSSPILSSHWDSWNSKQSNTSTGMTDTLKNESFGLDNSCIGKAEYRFHIPSSGNIYDRSFGI
ncbi:uncharacterized protein LOC110024146 [Phalaenopsis equestris]|uniref:uncharacterized protein LOC110024146 n=1 Tax=Phalaenopsis equestris TaxID=78828 RepID=UPI0009E4CC27|nr:uncharacterized protein LOC110024146 [Phalaenopsis equestris]XP_020579592.1 uncharacterized protein LOC110024146 [Phalaenopsis equestris]XP_020579593.1 uncharacterized protein LOC110024146 [Phalaenopsis equestris]